MLCCAMLCCWAAQWHVRCVAPWLHTPWPPPAATACLVPLILQFTSLSPSISSSKVRFDRPYIHPMALPGSETEAKLTVHQARFKEQGFASTGGCWRRHCRAGRLVGASRGAVVLEHNGLQKESSLQNGTSEPGISALEATLTRCTAHASPHLHT